MISDLKNSTEKVADIVFINGRIYTVDQQRSWAEAAAVKNGCFTFVGDGAAVEAYIGRGTRVVDLAGRMVLPGFIDSLPENPDFLAKIPMERYGKSYDEIAATVAFLASEGGAYITGQNIRVDGGITRSV